MGVFTSLLIYLFVDVLRHLGREYFLNLFDGISSSSAALVVVESLSTLFA